MYYIKRSEFATLKQRTHVATECESVKQLESIRCGTPGVKDFYEDIRNDLDAKFDTSDFSDERTNMHNCKRVNKKVWSFLKMSKTASS